jgi:hypothetical protein
LLPTAFNANTLRLLASADVNLLDENINTIDKDRETLYQTLPRRILWK